MNEKMLDYLNEGIVIFNKDYKILFCNNSLLKQLKYSKDELYNEHLEKIIFGPIDPVIGDTEKLTEQTITLSLCGYNLPPLQVLGKLFQNQWLDQESYWLIIPHYTQREYSIEELELIIENMPYSVWIADEHDHYKYSNSNTFTMINQINSTQKLSTTGELIKQNPSSIYKGSLDQTISTNDQAILRKGIVINEERMLTNKEDPLQYQLIKIPIFNDNQLYKGYIGISQYSIFKQNIDISKIIANSSPDLLENPQLFYEQFVHSLEFSTKATSIFQGNDIIILKFNPTTWQLDEICHLTKGSKDALSTQHLTLCGHSFLDLIQENLEWPIEDFEQRLNCDLKNDLHTPECHYIRINPIEYNNEFMGAILTTYQTKLDYSLMEYCIIDKLCQHIAISLKTIEYSLEQKKDLLIREKIESEKVAYQEALQLETLKTEFVANMSHELKTPLNIIYSTFQMLELEIKDLAKNLSFNPSKLERYQNVSKQNMLRLLRLINNITDMNKIGAGYYHARLVNCNIIKLIEDITMSVVEYVKNKELSITFDTEVEELIMACDPEKMERIILNLLSNAVKYTHKGDAIELTLHIINNKLIILVTDTGIGIPKEKQPLIFERFTQVDSSFSRTREGSGIGLALVKCLVELHEGTIRVESEEDKGSTFIVSLPIRQVEESHPAATTACIQQGDQLVYRCSIEFSDIYDL